jgi:hypothetical protein
MVPVSEFRSNELRSFSVHENLMSSFLQKIYVSHIGPVTKSSRELVVVERTKRALLPIPEEHKLTVLSSKSYETTREEYQRGISY